MANVPTLFRHRCNTIGFIVEAPLRHRCNTIGFTVAHRCNGGCYFAMEPLKSPLEPLRKLFLRVKYR